MQTKVMSNFVGENTRELLIAEVVDGECGYEHEVSAAGEGVEIVRIDNAENESVTAEPCTCTDRVPDGVESVPFRCGGCTSVNHGRKNGDLHGTPQQGEPASEPRQWNRPPRERGDDAKESSGGPHKSKPERRNDQQRGDCRCGGTPSRIQAMHIAQGRPCGVGCAVGAD